MLRKTVSVLLRRRLLSSDDKQVIEKRPATLPMNIKRFCWCKGLVKRYKLALNVYLYWRVSLQPPATPNRHAPPHHYKHLDVNQQWKFPKYNPYIYLNISLQNLLIGKRPSRTKITYFFLFYRVMFTHWNIRDHSLFSIVTQCELHMCHKNKQLPPCIYNI